MVGGVIGLTMDILEHFRRMFDLVLHMRACILGRQEGTDMVADHRARKGACEKWL